MLDGHKVRGRGSKGDGAQVGEGLRQAGEHVHQSLVVQVIAFSQHFVVTLKAHGEQRGRQDQGCKGRHHGAGKPTTSRPRHPACLPLVPPSPAVHPVTPAVLTFLRGYLRYDHPHTLLTAHAAALASSSTPHRRCAFLRMARQAAARPSLCWAGMTSPA